MGNLAFFAAADPFGDQSAYPQGAASDVTTGQLGTVGVNKATPVHSPDHGFFWFAVVAGATVFLIGASTHLKIGPVSAGASVKDK
jgi:hypothetical protein